MSRSFLARLPGLRAQLGPVASTSYRLASRITNSLKAGIPLREVEGLAGSDVVLFCAPGSDLRELAYLLAKADIDWRGKILLFCGSGTYSTAFPIFRERGAWTGSLNMVEGMPNRFILEGDPLALREARPLVRLLQGKTVELSRGCLLYYDAGVTFATSLFTPLVESCVECFRQAGMENSRAIELAYLLLSRSLRAYQHAGRKSWSGPVAEANGKAIDQQEKALQELKPLMGKYFRHAVEYAFDLYQTFPELTRHSKARWKGHAKRSAE